MTLQFERGFGEGCFPRRGCESGQWRWDSSDRRYALQDFFEIFDLEAIRKLALRLPHPSDGIIFTPVKLPYVTGTCPMLLKWKPPHLNTVSWLTPGLMAKQPRQSHLLGRLVTGEPPTVLFQRLISSCGENIHFLVSARHCCLRLTSASNPFTT